MNREDDTKRNIGFFGSKTSKEMEHAKNPNLSERKAVLSPCTPLKQLKGERKRTENTRTFFETDRSICLTKIVCPTDSLTGF